MNKKVEFLSRLTDFINVSFLSHLFCMIVKVCYSCE